VFRELLQHSNNASSEAVEIRFETKRYIDRNNSSEDHLPDPKTEALVCGFRFLFCFVGLICLAQVRRWTFKYNGILFRDEDWNRSKTIGAQGPNAGLPHS